MEKQKADKLILKFSSKVYGFAVKKSYSYDEAEELSAEMLKEVYLSMLQADDIVNVEGYVWRICEHVYAKYVNQIKQQKGVSLDGLNLPYFDEYDLGETEEEIRQSELANKKFYKTVFISKSKVESDLVEAYYLDDLFSNKLS